MEILLILLIFVSVLVLSNALNKVIPQLPVPFLQIVFGIIIGLFTLSDQIEFDTNVFLALIIGPLAFRESEEADVSSIGRHWRFILYLIFPLIFLTTLVLGAVIHTQLVVVPWAVAIATGAALGSTDLIAFSSLAERFRFSQKTEDILRGEGLLNDASGLVSYQTAILVWTTGMFSVTQAGGTLFVQIAGGIVVGFFAAGLNFITHKILMRYQAVDVAGELLLELSLPLLTFYLADQLQVSGIIAVVVAGILKSNRRKRFNQLEVEIEETFDTVWKAVNFMLNGAVFLILGIELVYMFDPIVRSPLYDNAILLGLSVLLTVVLFALRFIGITVYYALRAWIKKDSLTSQWKEIFILTFSGVKGTMSIATILLLPQDLKIAYPSLLFVVASVTLFSFLTGLLVLPYLADQPEEDIDYAAEIAVLNAVINQIEQDIQESTVKEALYAVLDNYNDRIGSLIIEHEGRSIRQQWLDLNLLTLSVENDGLDQAYEAGQLSERAYFVYQRYLRRLEGQVSRSVMSRLTFLLLFFFRVARLLVHEIMTFGSYTRQWLAGNQPQLSAEESDQLAILYLNNTEVLMDALAELSGVYSTELLHYYRDYRLREATIIGDGGFVSRVLLRTRQYHSKELIAAYYLERKIIHEFESDGLISSEKANHLRSVVNQLETYSLKENHLQMNLLELGSRRG
ncbi:sodium:proton antiporter [Streptococcus sp. NLN76]|uniref:cation:proton antiporter n=1 Tax=Streptococcus sp. NLN76 TaxID=2822800 RepID=UPI0018AC1073|nr:sodium:proton antiporter [Streptococcus sp. NLN76]MBF8970107.1 sodium:proton antiporter [Streptococcus sp. NLN76]